MTGSLLAASVGATLVFASAVVDSNVLFIVGTALALAGLLEFFGNE